jgi:hypothetical protein
LGGLFLKAMWSVFYEKNYWIKKRSYVFHDSIFYLTLFKDFIINNFIRSISFFRLNFFIYAFII